MPDIAGSFARGRAGAGGGQALADLISFIAELQLEQERLGELKRHNLAVEATNERREDRLTDLYELQLKMQQGDRPTARDVKGRLRYTEGGGLVFPEVEQPPSAEQVSREKGAVAAKDREFRRLYLQQQNPVGVPLTDEEELLMNQLRTDLRGLNQYDPVTGEPFTLMEKEGPTPFGADTTLQVYESPSGEQIYWNGQRFVPVE